MAKTFLKLVDINKSYPNGYVAIKNFNLNIQKGEFVTFLGPSGCGKTTTIKMIAGFEMPTSGKILINNVDIKDVSINKRPTATVFQDYALFPNLSVLENVSYGLKQMRKPLKGITNVERKKVEKAYKEAVKKAEGKIKKNEKTQRKILREIASLEKLYSKYPEVQVIRGMKYQQYISKLDSYLTQMEKKYGVVKIRKMSAINWLKRLFNKWNRTIFNSKRPVNYDTKGLNIYEKKIINLQKWFEYKKPLDKKIAKLWYQYNDLDQWNSHWSNYDDLVRENYEKKYTTRKLTKQEVKKIAMNMINLVGLKGKENLYPEDLSGGMKQRVALARALVVEPDIILLDEPLSALDAKVRVEMQNELKRMHNQLKLTFILVTHDQEEALSLSNKIVVMSKGKIEQVGTPKAIYDTPANEWVANFIGQANFFNGIYLGKSRVRLFDKAIVCRDSANLKQVKKNDEVRLMVRPEDVLLVRPQDGYIKTRITSVVYKGEMFEGKCFYKKTPIVFKTTKLVRVGDTVGIRFPEKVLHVLPIKEEYENEFYDINLGKDE